MQYKLKLNLQNLQITQAAKYRWSDPSSGAAHEGVTLNDGTQVSGYAWTDRTIERVDLPELMRAEVREASSLDEAFKATAQKFDAELKDTLELRISNSLEQAPDSSNFDYQKIKDSQSLSFE